MCKYSAFPTATVMCKYLALNGPPTTIAMCKYLVFKGATSKNCNVQAL